jgi:serine/threonine protein kinase
VALKTLLKPHKNSTWESLDDLLLAEIRSMRKLDHKNILKVIDYGFDGIMINH